MQMLYGVQSTLEGNMEFTTLGKSGVRTSKIGLGAWAIGGWMWGGKDDAQSIRTIHTALDQGITLIDTAPVYGFGHSEEVVGQAIAQKGTRDRIVLATKCALEWNAEHKVSRNAAPAGIEKEVEASLRRLKTSYIDLYQVHWPDPQTPFEDTGAALDKLKKAGKIRAVGVSNYNVAQMDAFAKSAVIDVAQLPYNLFERQIEAAELPYAHKHGITVLSYGAICRALLSGKFNSNSGFSGDDLRQRDPKFKQPRFDMYLHAVDALGSLAKTRYGKNVIALALRWVIDEGTVALWGGRYPAQLDPVKDVLGWTLDDAGRQAVRDVLKSTLHDEVGPEFMAPPLKQKAS